jgi:hypothetical protein
MQSPGLPSRTTHAQPQECHANFYSWIQFFLLTPTPKVTGSNPAGHTNKEASNLNRLRAFCFTDSTPNTTAVWNYIATAAEYQSISSICSLISIEWFAQRPYLVSRVI